MPMLLSDLRAEDFEALSDDTFTLAADEHELSLKLAAVQRLGTAMREGGAFSLMFTTAPGPSLPQATYVLRHSEMGMLEVFIVPLVPEGGRNRYEAIFT